MATLGLVLTSVVTLGVSYVLFNILLAIKKIYTIGKAVNQFPQDPKHWLFGHLVAWPGFGDEGLKFLRDKAARFPRYSAVWRTILKPSISVCHPDTVKAVLKRSDPKPTASGFYKFGLPWLGEGLLLGNGARWKRDRKLITPSFHFDILKSYIQPDNVACDKLIEKMVMYGESGESMEIYSNMSLCTLDVVLQCAFSYDNNVQREGESHPYVQAVGDLAKIWMKRTADPIAYFGRVWDYTKEGKYFYKQCDFVHTFADNIISSRKKALMESPDTMRRGKHLDFLDTLLAARDEDGSGLTDREIREEVDSFLIAGHDTTASSMSWVLYELAQHQDMQERCRQEAEEVLGDRVDVEWEDLGKFKYLTQCIKEVMRLHTIVPFIGRELKEELVLDGMKLPAGTNIDIQIYQLHHNPTVWEDSLTFDPDRFLPENIDKRDTYAFCPFSAGPRNCLGQNFSMQETKVILPRLLRRFRFELDPHFHLEKAIGLVTRPKNGLKMKVIPLQQTKGNTSNTLLTPEIIKRKVCVEKSSTGVNV